MEYTIVNLEPKQAISIKATTTQAGLGEKFMELLPELHGILKKQSLQMSGAPFGMYHSFSPEKVDMEAGIPVTGNPQPEGRMNVIQTYGGKAVKTDFYGHYDNLKEGWDGIMAYVKENNLQGNGAPFEIYVTDPGSEPDSSKWLTEIYIPVK